MTKCDIFFVQLGILLFQVLDGSLKTALFKIPSEDLVCSNSEKLLGDLEFKQLICPLEQEYPGQVRPSSLLDFLVFLISLSPRSVTSMAASVLSTGSTKKS